MRNVESQAKIGREIISINRDIISGELEQLFKVFKNEGLYNAVTQAYYFGVAVGIRQGKAEQKAKLKQH